MDQIDPKFNGITGSRDLEKEFTGKDAGIRDISPFDRRAKTLQTLVAGHNELHDVPTRLAAVEQAVKQRPFPLG